MFLQSSLSQYGTLFDYLFLVMDDEDENLTSVSQEPTPSSWHARRWVILSLALCNGVDAIETLAFGAVLPGYVIPDTHKRLDEDEQLSGALTSGVFVGMLVGGLVSGKAADMWGRKVALLTSMALNACSAVLSSMSPLFPGREVYWLLAFRIIAGVGIGGSVPCAFSLMAEWSPDAHRGSIVSLLAVAWTIGAIFTSTAAWLILSDDDSSTTRDNTHTWPLFLLVASMPAFVACFMVKLFVQDAPKAPNCAATFSEHETEEGIASSCQPCLVLCSISSVFYFLSYGSYGVSTWIGDIFNQLGFDPYGATLFFSVASIPGNLFALYYVDRRGRKFLLVLGLVLSGLAAIGFKYAESQVLVVTSACLFSASSTLAWVGMGVISSECFPREHRAFRLGVTAAFGRLGSITANLVNPWLLKLQLILPVAGIALFMGGVVSCIFIRDRTGKSLPT